MVFQPTTSFLTRREFLVSNPQHRQAPPCHDCYLSNGEERRCCRGSARWRWRRILCPSLQHPIPGDCDMRMTLLMLMMMLMMLLMRAVTQLSFFLQPNFNFDEFSSPFGSDGSFSQFLSGLGNQVTFILATRGNLFAYCNAI